jgi:hypothetical protein
MCELQQGTTLAFTTAGNAFQVISLSSFGAPIPVIDDTVLATANGRKKCPGKLQDPGQVNIVCRNVGTQARPTKGAVDTLTITKPLAPTRTVPEIFAGTGFIVDILEPEYNSDSEARQTFTIVWQFNGDPLPTRTLSS